MNFTHLQIKTEYSLSRGMVFYKDAVKLAKSRDIDTLGICDDGNLFGSYEFAKECVKSKIKPVIGTSLKISHLDCKGIINIFAKNNEGLENLLFISSQISLNKKLNGFLNIDILKERSNGLIVLSGGSKGLCGNAILKEDAQNFSKICNDFQNIFQDNFYMEITRHQTKDDLLTEYQLIKMSIEHSIPLCAGQRVFFKDFDDYEAHDVLTCIGEGRYLVEQDREKTSKQEYFKTSQEMIELFKDIPQLIENTNNIGIMCNIYPDSRKPMLPPFKSENGNDESTELRQQSIDGLKQRLIENGIANGFTDEDYYKRLEYEIEVINKMGFAGYFLIVSDFIKWSKNNNVPVGPGRGSGAGSIVAWVLYITDLDPLYYGLLFERFLNPDRVSMPDFDIDFCQAKRGLVIDYVKNKYGEGRVASIITFGKLQARAALKDVGRVLQLPYNQVDAICKMVPFNPVDPVTLQKAIDMDPTLRAQMEQDDDINRLITIALKLEGLNRHASIHAAGTIIGDKDLIKIVPLYKSNENDMQAVGYNMKAAEGVGLVKFDFLGLKTLTVIANTIKLIKQHYNVDIDISKIDMRDKKTFQLLQDGFTRGVFQLDSVVCRSAMKQMHIDKIEDIIALTSLNRPGPMENIPSYINRKIGKETVEYPHIILQKALQETYGVIIYQEQVMQVAQILSNYTLGQADLLRRAMGKKIKEEMDAQREIFVQGAMQNNIDKKKAEEIFELVEKFAGYGFNKSHAAAYSVISYQTAYLKAHYPLCFFVASLNMDIDDTDSIALFINEAREMGFDIKLPSILKSDAIFTMKDNAIYYALCALKAVGHGSMIEFEEIRNKNPKFNNIFEFCQYVGHKIANKRTIESLAKSGAFDEIHNNRREIVENVEALVNFASSQQKQKESGLEDLFDNSSSSTNQNKNNHFIKLNKVEEYNDIDKLTAEFEAVGFYISSHPLTKYKQKLEDLGIIWSIDVEKLGVIKDRDFTIKMTGVVTIVRQRSGKKGRFAFVHLVDLYKIFECTIFNSDLITDKRDLIKEGKVVGLHVSVQRLTEDETARLNIKDIFDIEEFLKLPPLKNSQKKWNNQYNNNTNSYKNETKKPEHKSPQHTTLTNLSKESKPNLNSESNNKPQNLQQTKHTVSTKKHKDKKYSYHLEFKNNSLKDDKAQQDSLSIDLSHLTQSQILQFLKDIKNQTYSNIQELINNYNINPIYIDKIISYNNNKILNFYYKNHIFSLQTHPN